jgi:hypothetical protein
VHKALRNEYILGFVHSEVIDKDKEEEGWVPGLYMILELAVGGDLFDKIGEFGSILVHLKPMDSLYTRQKESVVGKTHIAKHKHLHVEQS